MKRTPFRCLLALALCWTALRPAHAADPAPTPTPLPPVVARYEQMLTASPARGTAFDKVYQHFFEGPGLDALAARWQARAAGNGPGAETFPLLIGLLAERRAHPDDARAAYHQYNSAHPDDPRGWTALGELETSEGRFVPAADALAHALDPAAKPPVPVSTRPALYRELARAQARSFLVAASLGTWRKLAAEFPDDPGILQEVGEAFQENQAYDEARATFERVRELARKNNDAFGRINATLRTGQVEEARGHATEAVNIYEGVVAEAKTGSWLEREARARIEQLYRGQEDLPGLANYYQKSLADHPKNVETATRRAAVLIELNRRAEAIDLLRQAVAWAPERQELQVELARRLGETDRPAEMAAVMEKLTAAAPEEKSYWQLLGDARWQLLETLPATATTAEKEALKTQAIAAWTHLSPADGTDAAATGQLADLLASHRLKDEAVAQYARAAALAPDLPDARERWAGYLAQIDRRDEARRVVAGIVTASPKNATTANYARLSAALDRLDDRAGALAATEQGLSLEPRNFDLLSQRWQLLASAKRWADAGALYPALLAAAPNPYFAEQVQARQVAALQAAGQLAATRADLAARLSTLDENDLALLVRIDLQTANGDTDPAALAQTRQALAEARVRFPRAAAFVRLEGELARRARDVDGQAAALRRLIELQPAQKTDALTEITRVYRDAGRPDDATAAANELVLASPANAAAQTLLADLLLQDGHPDEGVARLRDAVRLSDKPNEFRLRLARVQTDLGRDADARRTLDAAFEAAGDSHERFALTKPLAEAYQRENRLDELITRFQTLQQGDSEGWRYALYLAEIYQETKDYGAARRELAKALAARPRDGSLLRQLVRVAGDEQNLGEIARYQSLLTEAEPSDQNKFALVTALLENNQAEAGFNALRANLAALLKIPGAWDNLLPLLARNDLTTRAGELLDAELGGDRADLKSRFTLALFQTVAGNLEPARAALWSVFDTRTGPASLPAAAPPRTSTFNRLFTQIYTGDSIPEQRYRAGVRTRRTAQGLLSPGGLAAAGRGRGTSLLASPGSGLPNAPSATDSARDAALVYLAALAVKDHTAAEFLAELDRHLAARDSSRTDRLVALALLEDVDGQLRETAAQVQNPEPGLDALALSRVLLVALNNHPQNRRYSESPPLTPAQAAALAPLLAPLLTRVCQADPSLQTADADSLRWYFLTCVGRAEEAESVRRAFLAHVDAHAPLDRLQTALGLLAEGGFSAADRAQLKIVVPAFVTAGRAAAATTVTQSAYYPATVFNENAQAAKLSPEEFADTLVSLVPLWYPPASAPAAGGSTPVGGNSSNRPSGLEPNTLPPTRFFERNAFAVIGSVAQSLRQGDAARLQAVLERLDQQARELPPDRRILPQLLAIDFLGLGGDPAAALTRARALLAAAPDDHDLRLLTSVLLGRTDHHAEAVALLDTVDIARTGGGESPFNFQRFLLAEAKAAKDTEAAKRAALRLAATRVPPDQRDSIAAELRELGLTEQADALTRPVASVSAASSASRQRSIFDDTTATRLQKFVADKNEDGALALARSVLAALPPPPAIPNSRPVNAESVLQATVAALKNFRQLDAVIADAEKQLAKDPDSLTLNYQLAVLHQASAGRDTAFTRSKTDRRPPVWLKLVRLETGEVAGFDSPDGQDWKEIGRAKIALGDAPLAVLPAASQQKTHPAAVVVDHVTLTPVPSGSMAPAPAAAPLPAPWAETPLADDGDAPSPPAAWHDETFTLQARGWDLWGVVDDARLVYRPLGEGREFAARVVSLESAGNEIKAGVMLRAGLDPDAPYAAAIVQPGGLVSFQHRDRADQSTAYWRKLAELRPREARYARLLAHRLAERGLRDEAAAVYGHLLDRSPDEGFTAYEDLHFIYRGSRSVALAKRLLAWKPGAAAAANGSSANAGFTFFQAARECAAQRQPELVAALCRHGLAWLQSNGSDQTADLNRLLFSALLQLGRRDEARDALVANFLPPADSGKTGGAVQLGFRNPAAIQSNGARRWISGLSWNLDALDTSGLRPLAEAKTAGLLPALQTALETRQQADPELSASVDLPWLLTIIRLDRRDPALLAELPALLDAKVGDRSNAQAEVGVRLVIARRLLSWPGHESLALEAFRSARKIVADARNTGDAVSVNQTTALGFQQAHAERLLGEERSALATLRALATEITAPNADDGNSSEETARCLDLLLRAGPEADPVYLDLLARSAKALEANQLLLPYDLEKNFRLAQNPPPPLQAFAWLLDDGGGGHPGAPDATLVYELRPPRPDDRTGPGRLPESQGRSFSTLEGERTLTFSYGPDPEHLAPLGQLKTNRSFGTWTGPVPPGAGVLEVTLDPAQPAAPGGGNDWLRIVRAPNLLTNPRFDGLSDRDPAAETFALPGWKDLPAGFWRQATGDSPLPGVPSVRSDTFTSQPQEITGARIPLEAGHAYFQGGWSREDGQHSQLRLGRRYLDTAGRVLKSSECPASPALAWRWQSQRLLSVQGDGDLIPPGTAFIEPFLRVQGSTEWTGLFLGKMD